MAMHLANAISYITDEEETQSGALVGSHNCNVDTALQEMLETKRQAREDAEHLLEEWEESNRRLKELEAENKNLHEQLLFQKSYAAGLQEQRNRQESGRTENSQQAKNVSEIRTG